jgi:hypothetical protein
MMYKYRMIRWKASLIMHLLLVLLFSISSPEWLVLFRTSSTFCLKNFTAEQKELVGHDDAMVRKKHEHISLLVRLQYLQYV